MIHLVRKLFLLSFLCISLYSFSQTIKGRVYDDEAIVTGAQLINTSQMISGYTNTQGYFELEAKVGDVLILKSLFHHEQTLVLKARDFEELMVIELKKAVNDLEEVLITKAPDFKPFDAIEANTILKNQILEDIKRNPHLYPDNSALKGNIFGVIGLVTKLFKSKTPKEPSETYASYNDLLSLFEKDTYFNERFLRIELNIPTDTKHLFFQFCEAHAIKSRLLLVENRFLLLDILLNCSNEFLIILAESQKE